MTGITKHCTKCKVECDTSLFNKNPRVTTGLNSSCMDCGAKAAKEYYWKNVKEQRRKAREYAQNNPDVIRNRKVEHPDRYLCRLARWRAKLEGIPFSLSSEDIKIPKVCPVLGIILEFSYGKHATDKSPTLDKLIPSLGYIPSNVTVISKRANRIKGDASLAELMRIVSWMKAKCGD